MIDFLRRIWLRLRRRQVAPEAGQLWVSSRGIIEVHTKGSISQGDAVRMVDLQFTEGPVRTDCLRVESTDESLVPFGYALHDSREDGTVEVVFNFRETPIAT